MIQNQKSKTIWIIGAGSGIGRALAVQLSHKGHRLILSGRRLDKLQDVKNECNPQTHLHVLDVSKQDEWGHVHGKIEIESGTPDIVIMMAGIYEPMTTDAFDIDKAVEIVTTNFTSALYMLKVIIPCMKAKGGGKIILCASVAGYRGLPKAQPYAATKAALINLAESARIDLSPYNIDVKIISPGFVKTELTDKNNFTMPMIITPDLAASRIVAEMFKANIFEIKTHYLFTWIMKIIGLMPHWLYFKLFKG